MSDSVRAPAGPPGAAAEKTARLLTAGICLVALALSFQMLREWVVHRPIDMDELEFVRATRWVAEGKVPYLDFWEHHFPLQWYLMAPVARLATETGVETFRVMRLANAAFWLSSAALVVLLSSAGGRRKSPGIVTVLLLLSAQYFPTFVTTYRIDGPMCFFTLLGVYLLEKSLDSPERARFFTASAGAALAFAGLSSQRGIPGVAAAALLYLFVRPCERWGFRREALPMVATGGAIAAAVAASWAALGGLGTFWAQNVVTNRIYEQLPAGSELPPFRKALWGYFRFSRSFLVVGILAAGAAALSTWRLRTPSFPLRMAILAVVQLLFLSSISSPIPYQQQLLWWLLAALAASAIGWFLDARPWPAWVLPATAALLLAAGSGPVTWGGAGVFPNFRLIQDHQDHVLKRLEEVTGPAGRVLDGCGWGMNRESAFSYWFLPRLVRVLTAHGTISPLTEKAMTERPPAAIVMDSRTVLYLRQVGLERFVSRHYVSLERAIWVPGMSGRLRGGEEAAWTVLVGGRYRLAESARHAQHPWFFRAFDFPRNTVGPADRFVVDVGKEQGAGGPRAVIWTVDGRSAGAGSAGEVVELRAGGRLLARNGGRETLAVFAVPERWNELMTMPFFPSWFEPSVEM